MSLARKLRRAVVGSAPAVTKTLLALASSTASTASYTFSSYGLSTATADRLVVIGIMGGAADVETVSSVTIAGISATLVANNGQGSAGATASTCLAYALVPSGTTGTIVVNWTAGMSRCAIRGWSLYNVQNTTPVDSEAPASADPVNFSLNTLSRGVALGVGYLRIAGTAIWTGLTEDFDSVFDTNRQITGASELTTGATINGNLNWSATGVDATSLASWR